MREDRNFGRASTRLSVSKRGSLQKNETQCEIILAGCASINRNDSVMSELPAKKSPADSTDPPSQNKNSVAASRTHLPADESGCGLTQDQLRDLFEQSSLGLRRFLRGRLPDPSDVDDCLQAVFVALIQHGGAVAAATRTAWLFRVAAN
ncbi:MAG: hypothetical protein WBD31_16285, partial [Rubripirellula sp.]